LPSPAGAESCAIDVAIGMSSMKTVCSEGGSGKVSAVPISIRFMF
jgi:hypothetical protein